MKRTSTGTNVATSIGGESVRAFVPNPLPPVPPLRLAGPALGQLERALLALGRLDSLSAHLPDTGMLLYSYVRKEAVLSSQIEGTQSSLSDLLLFEMEQAPGVPLDDVVEVSGYVAALDHGLARMRAGFPLSSRLMREVHATLLARGRGSNKDPGEFRRSQNWIGGTRPGNAVFVPPPHAMVADCVSELERFLHDESDDLPALVKAGLAHVQFETIHPFLDGNGRVGRLLIALFLCHAGVLRQPVLYLSLYFKQNRDEYYRLLNSVRTEGDWEGWITFFLEGVAQTALGAIETTRRLEALSNEDRLRVQTRGRRAGSALRVLDVLRSHPLVTLTRAAEIAGLSYPAASSAMEVLVHLDIAREISGRQRNRVYSYERYLAILSQGT